MRLRCFHCGTSVSTEVPDGTTVRAILECPECIEKQAQTTPAAALPPLPDGWRRVSDDAWKRDANDEWTSCTVRLHASGDVYVTDFATPDELMIVLRHAQAAQRQLQEGQ